MLWLSCLVFVFVTILVLYPKQIERIAFDEAFILDGFSRFFKIMILLSAAIVLAMSKDYLERSKLLNFEYSALISLSVIGMMIMVSSNNLMAVYLGLELQGQTS